MIELENKVFSDIVEFPPKVSLEKGKEYCYIPMEDIISENKCVKTNNLRKYTGGGAKFKNGDTVFARITPCLEHGKIAKVKDLETEYGFGSTEYFVFRAIENVSDSDYIYYLSKTDLIRQPAIKSMTGSSGRQRADKDVVSNLNIKVPKLDYQKRIAGVLNTYDNLIENNLRRIDLLEESARLLYREWFVHLRFPGHEHTKIINGVPEGWEMGCLGNLVKVQSGFAFKGKDWLEEGNPVIKIKNIGNNSININNCQCISDNVAEKASKFLLKEGDLLIAMTGATIGKIGIMPRAEKNYYLNQRVGIFKSKDDLFITPLVFTYLNTAYAQKQIKNFAAGSAQPNISPTQIESLKILIPNNTLLKAFLDITQPMFIQKSILTYQTEKLKQARDILLPRLMNGDIAV